MHIAMVCARYLPLMGGIETHVHEAGRRLVGFGHRVDIITTDASGDLPPQEVRDGLSVIRVPAWPQGGDLYMAPGLGRAIDGLDDRPDVIHVQGYHTLAAPIAMMAALTRRIPYVLSFHSGGHSSRLRNVLRRPQRAALRPLIARAAKLVAVSEHEVTFFSNAMRLPTDRFTHVPNGAEMPVATASAPAPPTAGTMVLSVGRLERYKGHGRAIAAMPHLLRIIPDARLRIVGAGPYEATLRRLAEKSGVGERIEIGAIPPADRHGMADAMRAAALVVLLSDYEAHPVAVMEAVAIGRPVLVADTSGLSEIARAGLAVAVPADLDPAATAVAMARQIAEPVRGDAPGLPNWEVCARRLAAVYEEVLT